MLVIGLTGGIGSGKSTVADRFAEHGAPIIDTDIIAREVTEPNQPALEQIKSHFGAAIIATDGTLDRKKLRDYIFEHPHERLWLEKLLHPLILAQVKHLIQTTRSAPYCIVVIPLLAESKPFPFIHRILVVDT